MVEVTPVSVDSVSQSVAKGLAAELVHDEALRHPPKSRAEQMVGLISRLRKREQSSTPQVDIDLRPFWEKAKGETPERPQESEVMRVAVGKRDDEASRWTEIGQLESQRAGIDGRIRERYSLEYFLSSVDVNHPSEVVQRQVDAANARLKQIDVVQEKRDLYVISRDIVAKGDAAIRERGAYPNAPFISNEGQAIHAVYVSRAGEIAAGVDILKVLAGGKNLASLGEDEIAQLTLTPEQRANIREISERFEGARGLRHAWVKRLVELQGFRDPTLDITSLTEQLQQEQQQEGEVKVANLIQLDESALVDIRKNGIGNIDTFMSQFDLQQTEAETFKRSIGVERHTPSVATGTEVVPAGEQGVTVLEGSAYDQYLQADAIYKRITDAFTKAVLAARDNPQFADKVYIYGILKATAQSELRLRQDKIIGEYNIANAIKLKEQRDAIALLKGDQAAVNRGERWDKAVSTAATLSAKAFKIPGYAIQGVGLVAMVPGLILAAPGFIVNKLGEFSRIPSDLAIGAVEGRKAARSTARGTQRDGLARQIRDAEKRLQQMSRPVTFGGEPQETQ